MEARPPFEFVDFKSTVSGTSLAPHFYITLFRDSKDGEVFVINPRSILRMRVESEEALLCDIPFESKFSVIKLSTNGQEDHGFKQNKNV